MGIFKRGEDRKDEEFFERMNELAQEVVTNSALSVILAHEEALEIPIEPGSFYLGMLTVSLSQQGTSIPNLPEELVGRVMSSVEAIRDKYVELRSSDRDQS